IDGLAPRRTHGSPPLPRESEDVRIDDLGPDAVLVHEREALLDARAPRVHLVDLPVGELDAGGLAAVAIGDARGGADGQPAGAVDGPDPLAVEHPHLRDAVAVLRRRARGPEVERLAEMGVHVDDLDALGQVGVRTALRCLGDAHRSFLLLRTGSWARADVAGMI